MRRAMLALVVLTLWGAASATAAPLDPLVSVGCWSAGEDTCATAATPLLSLPHALAVAPDGTTVYAGRGGVAGGITWLTRDTSTGALTPAGCLADLTASPPCSGAPVVGDPVDLATSPDGKSVYVVNDGRLVVLDRDAGGALSYRECFEPAMNACAGNTVPAVTTPNGVAVSPDNLSVYVVSRDTVADTGYLSVFTRDTTNGDLTYAGCFQAAALTTSPTSCGANSGAPGLFKAHRVTVSPDGANVYVSASASTGGYGSVVTFTRSGTGALTHAGFYSDTTMRALFAVQVTPDGKSLYVADYGNGADSPGLHEFTRTADGMLSGHGCWTDPQNSGVCGAGRAVADPQGARSLAVTNDRVYVGGYYHNSITLFTRDATSGVLTHAGCVRSLNDFLSGCGDENELPGMTGLYGIALTADGRGLYSVGSEDSAVAGWQAPASGGQPQPPGGDSGPGGGPGPGGGNAVAPALSAVSLKGQTLTLTLDRAATINVAIKRLLPGRKAKGKCVAPKRKLRKAKRCTRRKGAGRRTVAGKAGVNKIALRVKKAGRYQVVVSATADGLTSAARKFTLKVKRKR